ncbi:MAG: hypothetical protein LBC42_03260 [Puniceicoccales bacterium]|jgi:hypothetical protein|nr:hypothetical protein [Puniceicoccales bacterium]
MSSFSVDASRMEQLRALDENNNALCRSLNPQAHPGMYTLHMDRLTFCHCIQAIIITRGISCFCALFVYIYNFFPIRYRSNADVTIVNSDILMRRPVDRATIARFCQIIDDGLANGSIENDTPVVRIARLCYGENFDNAEGLLADVVSDVLFDVKTTQSLRFGDIAKLQYSNMEVSGYFNSTRIEFFIALLSYSSGMRYFFGGQSDSPIIAIHAVSPHLLRVGHQQGNVVEDLFCVVEGIPLRKSMGENEEDRMRDLADKFGETVEIFLCPNIQNKPHGNACCWACNT